MKAYYAHYSRPYGGDISNAQTHWALPHVEFITLAYSSKKSKEFFGHTVLVTDKKGKEVIIDTLKIPFDEVRVELDDCETKKRFWASGKIHAYTKSIGDFEPFIFFDSDAGFHSKPPDHLFKSQYRCQHIHYDRGTIFARMVKRLVRETPNEFPYDIYHEINDVMGANAGIIIMNDEDVLNEFSRYTVAIQNSPFFDKIESEAKDHVYKHLSLWNVVVEEILLLQIYKRKYGTLPDTLFDIKGLQFPKNTPNPYNYFHIWGSKRKEEWLRKMEAIAVEYIDKEVKDNIYKFFKI